ncbi:MAG: hypothetical protein ABI675_13640 [Chitinophagaceae bacterium]
MQITGNKLILTQGFSRGYGFYPNDLVRPSDILLNEKLDKISIVLLRKKINKVLFHKDMGIFTALINTLIRKNY